MFYLGRSLLFATVTCALCYFILGSNAVNVAYNGRRNEYFEISPIQRFETRSAIACCTLCDLDETCVATNTNRATSECELLAQRPQVRDDFVTKQNWTLFLKPEDYGEDWVYFNQSYYLPVKDLVNWYHADGHCMTLGAELVDIHSPVEHEFVYNLSMSNGLSESWIGLNDIAEEGTFSWSTGRSLTYEAFYPGEPNDREGQDCVINIEVYYAMENAWDDSQCTRLYAYICKKSSY